MQSSVPSPEPSPSYGSALIVDDDNTIARVFSVVLRELFREVEIAPSPIEALQKLKKKNYDLILLDFNMPYMDGLSLTEKLSNMDIHTPTILISAYITPDVTLRAFQLGVIDLIAKPPTPQEIRSAVNTVLQRATDSVHRSREEQLLNDAKRSINLRRFDEALRMLEELDIPEKRTDIHILLAMTYESLGSFEKAEAHYKKALTRIHDVKDHAGPAQFGWLEPSLEK